MGKRILVAGSINRDMILMMDAVPGRGETTLGGQWGYGSGGKGANAAVAAARLGGEVLFAGAVGNDDQGLILRRGLERERIDTRYLKTVSALSGLAVILLEKGGHNRIIVYQGANACVTQEDADALPMREADALMLQFEISPAANAAFSRAAAKEGVPVVVDCGAAMDFPLETLSGVTILSPNETECETMTGINPLSDETCLEASRMLMRRSRAKFIVLKLGARGAYLFDGREGALIPAFPITPVDTTAAGDAFTGALALCYVQSGDIRGSILRANAAGALAATRLGAQESMPTMRQVEEFIRARA